MMLVKTAMMNSKPLNNNDGIHAVPNGGQTSQLLCAVLQNEFVESAHSFLPRLQEKPHIVLLNHAVGVCHADYWNPDDQLPGMQAFSAGLAPT